MCKVGYLLVDYQCKTACLTDKPVADTNDRICKNTIYETDNPCPHGTYNSADGAMDSTSCKSCDQGYYCPNRGATARTAQCAPGYYCLNNSPFMKPSSDYVVLDYFTATYGGYCAPGQYCPQGTPQPIDCDPGYFCPTYLMSDVNTANKCSAGFYCSGKAKSSTPKDALNNICPGGNFCPEGSTAALKCPAGTFLSYTGAKEGTECQYCLPGQYCATDGLSVPTGSCLAGYYCPVGMTQNNPADYACPMGYICPAGSKTPQLCQAGYYTLATGSTSCTQCPVGKYCSGDTFGIPCDSGHYCPGNNLRIECPIGTYGTVTDATLVSQCTSCDVGFSCEATGLLTKKSKCDVGYICTGSAITTKPWVSSQGGRMCIPGEYCPLGSSSATTCPAGKYCKNYASGVSTSDCEAGYYCPTGQTQKNPSAYLCPPGSYCPAGSTSPIACPKGTYSPSQGASAISDCQPCAAGKVCNAAGISSLATGCAEGYYCPAGVSVVNPQTYLCEIGYMCPAGSSYQKICLPGTYQPERGKAVCNSCPAGYFCDGTDPGKTQDCPPGFYCPIGTRFAKQYPCPPGTYNPSPNKIAVTDCLKIPRGYYSYIYGATQADYKLLKGTYSLQDGLMVPKQTPCPRYFYCPEGTVDPLPCPNGKTTMGTGTGDISECMPCPRGSYCKFADYFSTRQINAASIAAASTDPEAFGLCSEGYICLGGSYSRYPNDFTTGQPCDLGFYCPEGAPYQIQCPAGTYNAQLGQPICSPCPEGYYCNSIGLTEPIACITGHFCPAGSIHGTPCPIGTYLDTSGGTSSSDCKLCPAGQFCDTWGLSAPAGECDPGFICVSGAKVPTPQPDIYTEQAPNNGRCPPKYYCTKGALTPIPCPAGTYNPNPGQSSCTICPSGQYCDVMALDKPTGQCSETYFCEQGSIDPSFYVCNPLTEGYCPQGAVAFSQCPDGKYLLRDGTCTKCTLGKKCTNGLVIDCEANKFCADSEKYPYGQLCLNGTYSGETGLTSPTSCKPCPTKSFCLAGRIMDECNAGYICQSGADSPTPYNRTSAYACPLGYYCPQGTSTANICPLGMYTFEPGSVQAEECDYCRAGYYCQYGAPSPYLCTPGAYCPTGSQEPTNCSVTRYNPNFGGADYTACLPCKGGYICNDEGLANLFSFGDAYKCPLGSYCPPATWRPYQCRAGSYAGTDLRYPPAALQDCPSCPQHYYCPLGTPDRYNFTCKTGTYCPAGSSWPILCPAGKFCNQTNDTSTKLNVIVITDCPEGFYCPIGTQKPVQCKAEIGEICKAGSSFPSRTIASSSICKAGQYYGYGMCLPCEPGFVCQNATNTKFPVYLSTEGGFECPPGYYCPKGSAVATPCPIGTFRAMKKGKSVDDCSTCSYDSYNDKAGQISCTKCGRGSTGIPDNNYQSCICLGKYRQWRKSDNQCVCQSGFVEPPLPTIAGSTSVDSQDCLPNVETACATGSHFDSTQKICVLNSACASPDLCDGMGDTEGYYSETAKKCLCNNVNSSADSFCDATCRQNVVKAYLMPNGQICLKAGNEQTCYNQSVFGSNLFLEGMTCSSGACLISNMNNVNGIMQGSYEAQQIFVDKWKETHPSYTSPYQSSASTILRELFSNSTTRVLQSATANTLGNAQMSSAIICTIPSNPVSFSVSREHFPIYLKDSLYNTNDNFDSGVFENLQTKLLNANMSISTFMYTFSQDEGVYVFGDYANEASLIIVKVSTSTCKSYVSQGSNIFPMTEDNLDKFAIKPKALVISELSDSLIAAPLIFILLTFLSSFIQHMWEKRIERQEYELRQKRAGRRRNFQRLDGNLDKSQYLGDLYKLIKDNMDEVTRMINENKDKENLLKLLKEKTSLLNELGDGGKQSVEEMKTQLKQLLEELRFPDGSTLKDLLIQKQLQKKLQQTLNKQSVEEPHDDEIDLDELDRRTESQGSGDDDDDESHMLTDNLSNNGLGKHESDDDGHPHKHHHEKDAHELDVDMQRQLKLKREQDRRKNDFKDRMCDLIDDEHDRDKLIDGFEDKMRSLDYMLKSESQRQQDNLNDKLASRKNRKKAALAQLHATTVDKEQKVEELEEDKRALQEQLEDVLENGMKDPQLKAVAQKEKEDALDKIERSMLEKQDLVRQEYINRLKGAKSDKEKERIVDEMQRRLQAIEEELAKEKAEQERNLEKILMLRQQKRVKKLAHDAEKEIEKKDQQIKQLQSEIDKEKADLYVEHGGDLVEVLDQKVKEKASQLVDKSVIGKETNLDLDKSDHEQLDILKVQQKIDREHALNAVEKDMDDANELEKIRMEEQLKAKLQVSREDFNSQIARATNEKERKKLIKDSKMMEQRIEDEINNERLRQERLLEEKRKNRKNQRKVKEMEIEQKQMQELATKETELLQKKYDNLMSQHAQTFDKDMKTALVTLEKRGNADKAILLVNQTQNDLLEKRLRLLINKQFFELEKYLGTMYSQTALERMVAKEKSRSRFKAAEEEAISSMSGDALVSRLAQLKDLERIENEGIDMKYKQQEKEKETEIRERLENKFFEEKRQAHEDDKKKREELIKGILERNSDGSQDSDSLKELASKLLKANEDKSKEELEKMEKDKEAQMERIKLQIVAENEAEVQLLQKQIEDQMAKEKEKVENRMKARRDQVMGEKKRNLEDRIKEMSGNLSEMQKDLIMKQFMKELDALEKAIAIERDSQLTKMRAKLIKKKIEAERLKKDEINDRRVREIKKQIGQYLLASIKAARQRAEAANQLKVQKAQPKGKPTSSQQKKRVSVAPKVESKQELVGSNKDILKILLNQWSSRINEQKADQLDQQNIWEKQTDRLDSPKSSVSKMSKVTGLQGLRGGVNTTQMSINQQANSNFTMDELFRRIRRIERLTDKMSKGQFEDQKAAQKYKEVANEAQKAIESIRDGNLSQLQMSKVHSTQY